MQDIEIRECLNCKNHSMEYYRFDDDYKVVFGNYCKKCNYEDRNGKVLNKGNDNVPKDLETEVVICNSQDLKKYSLSINGYEDLKNLLVFMIKEENNFTKKDLDDKAIDDFADKMCKKCCWDIKEKCWKY
jgi:hypothetical protein